MEGATKPEAARNRSRQGAPARPGTKERGTALDTTPYWFTHPIREHPPLDRDLRVDVAIVGGGITGVTAAYLLKKAGRKVALLDRKRCGEAETGHTTAHLSFVTDERLATLAKRFGDDHARAVWDAGLAALATIDSILQNERIDCDFDWVPGFLHLPLGGSEEEDLEALHAEVETAQRLGYSAVFHDSIPFLERPGVEFEGQARFHPRKYLAALLERIDGDGSFVFDRSAVDEVEDDPLVVRANGHAVRCDFVVVATNAPIQGKSGFLRASILQTKLAPYSTYAVGGRVASGLVPDALFWDGRDDYRYLRVECLRGVETVIYGGEDHETGRETDTRKRFEKLERDLRRIAPGVEITHRWSGQVLETDDGLPFIGETSRGQFVATGYAGNGMTFGTLAGMMAADRAIGRDNPWSELFDAGRTGLKGSVLDYIKRNKDYPYYLIRDRLVGPEGRSLRAVRRGQGKVLELSGRRVAAYRGTDGILTLRSAVCTHLACIVHWNDGERTWDCPCHGSRFSTDGEVVAGPAETPLQVVEEVHA